MKKRVTFTIDEDLLERLKKVSADSLIPQARLVEKAITDVIEEYEKKSERD